MRREYLEFFSKQEVVRHFRERISEKKSSGVDGVRPQAYGDRLDQHSDLIVRKVAAGTYKFTRYKEKLILKGASSLPREVSIPTVRDSCVLRCLLGYLEEYFPEAKPRRPHFYIAALKERIRTCADDSYFVRVDIRDFYPSISHSRLFARLRKRIRNRGAISLLRSAITTSCKKGVDRGVGVPQGLSISNYLSNLFLLEVDEQFRNSLGEGNYFRYVDDILVVTEKERAKEVFQLIKKVLTGLRLKVHDIDAAKGKSVLCPISDGIDYLGFRLNREGVSVRSTSIQKLYDTLSSVVTSAKYNDNYGRMCFRLDTKITGCVLKGQRFGWLHFFQQMDDIALLGKLDGFVASMLQNMSGLPRGYRPKRFLKSYYEIRYKGATTRYIPDFDHKTREEKIRILTQLSSRRFHDLESRSDEEISDLFSAEMKKIASELERDLQESTS